MFLKLNIKFTKNIKKQLLIYFNSMFLNEVKFCICW
jgi:hypothetical protein